MAWDRVYMGGKVAERGAEEDALSENVKEEEEMDDHEFFEEMEDEMDDEMEEFEPVGEPGPNTREQFEDAWDGDERSDESVWDEPV
jgi:hypothetical protein